MTDGPTIVCPSWCLNERQAHIEDLPEIEGSCIHYSPISVLPGFEGHLFEVFTSRVTYIDGTLDTRDGPSDLVYVEGQSMTPEQAEKLAEAIHTAVQEARS